MKNVVVNVHCPECGTLNKFSFDELTKQNLTRGKLVVCNLEKGGCDSTFVLGFDYRLEAQSKPIEKE